MWVLIACFCLTLFVAYCLSKSSDKALQHSAVKFLRTFSNTDFSSAFDANEAGEAVNKSQPQRRTLTALMKKKIASNFQWRCASCAQLLDWSYEIDHILPLADGGSECNSDDFSNCQPLCLWCHRGRKTSPENSARNTRTIQLQPKSKRKAK